MQKQKLLALALFFSILNCNATEVSKPPEPQEMIGLLRSYVLALNKHVRMHWNTDKVPESVICDTEFTQTLGGHVIEVKFLTCPFDEIAKESVVKALNAEPLPYAGYEHVFSRVVKLSFCHPEEKCRR